jgi:hypothetical protein
LDEIVDENELDFSDEEDKLAHQKKKEEVKTESYFLNLCYDRNQ